MSQPIDIAKNTREITHIERQTFKRHDLIDLLVLCDAGGGEMKPRKQRAATTKKKLILIDGS